MLGTTSGKVILSVKRRQGGKVILLWQGTKLNCRLRKGSSGKRLRQYDSMRLLMILLDIVGNWGGRK